MQYRKKPVVIEAIQYTGSKENLAELLRFCPILQLYEDHVAVKTLESQHFDAQEGDWLIKGVKGEFYFCKSDIFEQTYEAVTVT